MKQSEDEVRADPVTEEVSAPPICPRTGAPCTTIDLFVRVLPDNELSRARRYAVKPVDTCVAGVVIALNGVGVGTIGSCCGHGVADMSILLDDGRELFLGKPT